MKTRIANGHTNIRLPYYDYKNGWIFITNVTHFRSPYLTGSIRNLVEQELYSLSKQYSGVRLDYGTIVPTHIHCILILENADYPLSEVWRRFKARTTLFAKRAGFITTSLWQMNFYEHIIRNDVALDRIREYIRNNPLKEELPLYEIYG